MAKTKNFEFLKRINFGKLEEVSDIPYLIEVQVRSYESFLQQNLPQGKRKNEGLFAVFREVFPIESYDEKIKLDFVDYELGEAKLSPAEAIREGETYCAPLYVTFRLTNESNTMEERVYMGELPLMTNLGSFIINGAERVVVSQLHRSPGICFESSTHTSGKELYSYRIIPDRGSWLEVSYDNSDLLYVHLDRRRRRRKFLLTTLLRAFGFSSNEEIISIFYNVETYKLTTTVDEEEIANKIIVEEVRDTANQDLVVARSLEPLTTSVIGQLIDLGIKSIKVVDVSKDDTIVKCLKKDSTVDTEDALKDIYKKLRPGDPPTVTNAKAMIKRLFFDPKRFDIGRVGRYKINQKLGLAIDIENRVLTHDDIIAATKHLITIKLGENNVDDIDHLGSRRIRSVGELLANQCRTGLARTERLVKERITLFDVNTEGMTPQKLINPKALSAVIKDFFGRSQLSQLMDQTNPLSEITHKRRLSALGPGGLNRDRAGFEVRDVHPSHYGRICPIETPEGPNIGLIASMSCFARVNEFGFIETPYRRVEKGAVTEKIDYLTADQEQNYFIAQANSALDDKKKFKSEQVSARYQGEFTVASPDQVQYMDISPKQLVSVAAGLIPFLEHDDANRALMGSNMQRQGVPLMITDSPYVGTGMEAKVARDSGAVVVAEGAGIAASVTAREIIITKDGEMPKKVKHDPEEGVYVYTLRKFNRSNSGTCYNQKPIITKGDKITKGQVIADGPCTQGGELALGRNMLVAFMPWNGYNFEDAIVINERIAKEDIYTSIHIEEFEISARDTKLRPEEITRDIPNVGDEALKNLGPDGVVRIGAEVNPGDILVGKITPKSETELAPEERLLRAIFGEKAADVKDSSLVVPSGIHGIVMDIKVTAGNIKVKQKLSPSEAKRQLKTIEERYSKKEKELVEELTQSLSNILLNEKIPLDVVNAETGEIIIPANRKITKTLLRKMAESYDHIEIDPSPIRIKIREIISTFEAKFQQLENEKDMELERIEAGDDVDPGIIKQVKVYIASKRKLSVGDKMAGRHGNKGVVATIVPEEDMPFLPDGSPVDIVLNPLGVPSRMNVGQVLETHLGIAARLLGFKVATPVFDGISEKKIREYMVEAGYNEDDYYG